MSFFALTAPPPWYHHQPHGWEIPQIEIPQMNMPALNLDIHLPILDEFVYKLEHHKIHVPTFNIMDIHMPIIDAFLNFLTGDQWNVYGFER